MCRTIPGGLRGDQPAGAGRLILGVSLMAPTPGDKSLCFITGTRDGTRVASDRGGGSVVTNDSLAWQLVRTCRHADAGAL
jgi:hypothetical protein